MSGDTSASSAIRIDSFLRALAIRVAVGLALGLLVLLVGRGSAVQRMEERAFDLRVVIWRQLSEADTTSISIVAVDEESYEDLNAQWPLPRGVYARAIARLRKAGAEVIGVTVVFEGPAADPLQDQALASTVDGSKDVVLASRLDLRSDPPAVLAPSFNCPSGFCDVPLDGDGVVRHFYLSPAGVAPPPACMALQLLRAKYDDAQFIPRGFAGEAGSLYPISWAGAPDGTFHTISLKKVLSGADLHKDVKGRIVLLGSTLSGPANSVRTPFARGLRRASSGRPMTAVELTANMVYTLLGADSLQSLSPMEYRVLIVGLVFFPFVLFGSLHPLFSLICALFLMVLYSVGATYSMIMTSRLMPLVHPLVGLAAAWGCAAIYRVAMRLGRRWR